MFQHRSNATGGCHPELSDLNRGNNTYPFDESQTYFPSNPLNPANIKPSNVVWPTTTASTNTEKSSANKSTPR